LHFGRNPLLEYASALSELPALNAKLEKAIAAQENLEKMAVQKRLVDGIKAGALRGPRNVITRSSFTRWLSANEEAMKRTRSGSALLGAALDHAKALFCLPQAARCG
jgi:hypothetical protein